MPRVDASETLPARPVPAPWTASRCNRTIRQLASFVNRLEKWHRAYLAAQEEADSDNGPPRVSDEEGAGEPQIDWLAANVAEKKQKSKRTYLQRSRRPGQPISVPKLSTTTRTTAKTPKKRSVPLIPDKCGSESFSAGKKNGAGSPRRNGGWSHKWTSCTVHLALEYERIILTATSTISTFLVATSDPKRTTERAEFEIEDIYERPERGARSLFDTCLHKLSKNMVEQQKQCDAGNDDFDGQFDTIGSQLQELEDYFGDPKVGWPFLRNVTRDCGIHMVANLIETGALPEAVALDLVLRFCSCPLLSDIVPAISRALVDLQLHSPNPDAGYHELPSYTGGSGPSSPLELVKERMSVEWTLLALRGRQDSVEVVSRFIRYAHLMQLTRIWICKTYDVYQLPWDYCSEILEAVYIAALAPSQTDPYPSIRGAKILPSVLEKRATEPARHHTMSEQVWNRLRMAFTLLLLLNHGQYVTKAAGGLIERISKKAQILHELDQDFALSEYQLYFVAHIFFCNVSQLLITGRHPPKDLLDSFESVLNTIESCASESWWPLVGDFVMVIITQNLDSEKFQEMVQQLLSLDWGNRETLELVLGMVCADAAMEYAGEHHDDTAMLKWATEVHKKFQEKMEKKATEPRTPAMRIAYCWDEAIEEWIAKPPGTLAAIEEKGADAAVVAKDPCNEDQNAAAGDYRKALRPVVNDKKPVWGNRPKRKSAPCDLEIHKGGDFEYKKRPRRHVSFGNVVQLQGHGSRIQEAFDQDSEDELSLLV
ncbi:hypothetical protein A1O3_01109 [Capronia epimyces CBS 606.96]|uniref:Uncharacterized protein n=1 Tax=Capronia epimyces CBS 606.96 TaxID=1182542 RepID=W9YI39_9EURO|nr:uncharacterized protein A1O3_01109 [Capronia epimyces CBS 606.96]EXJ92557.1 hypothetical protein A1O3_01109 [Capronia epimyces CBS 606.96]